MYAQISKSLMKKLTFFIIIKENSAIKKKKVYLPTMNLKYSAAFMEFSTLLKSWRILSAQATVSQIWRMTAATSSPGDPSLSCQSNASLFPISFKHPPSPFPASLARGLSFQRNVQCTCVGEVLVFSGMRKKNYLMLRLLSIFKLFKALP